MIIPIRGSDIHVRRNKPDVSFNNHVSRVILTRYYSEEIPIVHHKAHEPVIINDPLFEKFSYKFFCFMTVTFVDEKSIKERNVTVDI